MTASSYHIRLTQETEPNIVALVCAMQEHLGDDLQVHDCLELVTDRPKIACAIEALFAVRANDQAEPPAAPEAVQPAEAPTEAPAEEQPKRRKRKPLDQTADLTGQVMLWRIQSSGRSISILLAKRKLQIGEVVINKNRGKFEVYETDEGKLSVRPLRTNGHRHASPVEAGREEN